MTLYRTDLEEYLKDMAISALPNFSIGLFLPILIRNWALAEVTARNATSAVQ